LRQQGYPGGSRSCRAAGSQLNTQAAPDPAAPDPAAPIPFASVPEQPERYVNEGVDALNRSIGHLSRYYMHQQTLTVKVPKDLPR